MIEQMVKTYTCTTCGFTSTDKLAVATCQSVRKPEPKHSVGDTVENLYDLGDGDFAKQELHIVGVAIAERTHNVIYEYYRETSKIPEKNLLSEKDMRNLGRSFRIVN